MVLGGILLTRLQSYLLFHGVAEAFSIVIACSVFIYAWNARKILNNGYLTVIGISFLSYSAIALVHTLSFKGMGVFPANSANLPTQLWIAGRYLLAVSLLVAPFLTGKTFKPGFVFTAYLIVTLLLFLSIFYWRVFPACYIDGKGLTQFKIDSEYVIAGIFLLSILALFRKRSAFKTGVFWLLAAAASVAIFTEIAFTRYVSVYSSANLVGHLLNIVAFYLFYEAILVTGFHSPLDTLARDMNQAVTELNESNAVLLESNAKLDLALRSARMGVWHWDVVADKRIYDGQTCSLLGLDPAAFTGAASEFLAAVHPDDRTMVGACLARTLEHDAPYEPEYRAVWADGSIHYLTARGRLVRDNAGLPLRIDGILWDVTERKQAEVALSQSEQKYREIIDQSIDGIMITDAMGNISIWNKGMERITGIKRCDAIGSPAGQVQLRVLPDESKTPERTDQISNGVKRLLESKTDLLRQTTEQAITSVDGIHKVVQGSSFLVKTGTATLLGTVMRDITARKQVEKELQESHRTLQQIIETIPARVFWKDRSSVYLGCNTAFAIDAGFARPEDIIGKSDRQLAWSDAAEIYRSDDLQVMDSGISKLNFDETQVTLKKPPMDALTSKVPLRDTNGDVVGILGTFVDITGRKKSELALRESEERFREVVENSLDAAYKRNLKSNSYEYLSPVFTEISGYNMSEMNNLPLDAVLDLIHPDDTAEIARVIAASMAEDGRPDNHVEYRFRRKDGEFVWLHDQFIVTRDSGGQPLALIGSVRDVTERKQAEDYREMGREVLQELNEQGNKHDSIQLVLNTLKKWTGFDAVGIRLQNGEDFPYFVQEGFPGDFLLTENILVERGADGGICRDSDGNVKLECTCGLVISGKTDPSHPLFTPGGSAWTNDSFPILDLPPGEDPRLHPRNRCIHRGYASIALIPIRNHENVIGLLQFNDRRKGCFTIESIELLEGIASHIGSALARKQSEEALQEGQTRLELAAGSAQLGIWDWDIANNKMIWDDQMFRLYGIAVKPAVYGIEIWQTGLHPDDVAFAWEACQAAIRGERPYHIEFRVRHPDGNIRFLKADGTIFRDGNGTAVRMLGVNQDITERKNAENKIKASLAEKEVILKEIHHRVKNNMQVISSLLSLQSQYVKDKYDARLFEESRERILSMSLVYNKLYQSVDLAHINFNEYVDELVSALIRSYNCNTGKITTRIEADGVELGLDLAIPCGLIINEVISNSLKYAFPNGSDGEIWVVIRNLDGRIDMSLGDNGVGIPGGTDIKTSKSLGMILVQTLATGQLDGTLELKRANGTEYRISFPCKPQENRG